ncbi:hypothetical protein [Rhizobium sp. FY34]|uniref:hypothetical protein n=1 Tax=Rhizobium sp. FY34 TaxID=2562309 RepID=UPI0010C00568|nr:hypothetical protein [Rhizobium sp. FY34]
MTETGAAWRDDLDALQFAVADHGGACLIHRLAFRALIGMLVGGPAAHKLSGDLSRDTCLAFFAREEQAFHAAAEAKIRRQFIPPGRNLHLNSRDIRRAMAGDAGGAKAKACRVLGG